MRRLLLPVTLITAFAMAVALAPAPGAAPAQSPEPAPSPTETPIVLEPTEPSPTPTPAPTLSVHPQRRSVSRAVLDGFRVRTECAGGCDVVRVRVFISPLTARQRHIRKRDGSRHTEEVVIGNAPTQRDAGGTRTMTVLVRGAYARKLAGAKELRIAVEAEATNANGATRTATKRLVLRR